jgi:hypothetical protein
MNVITEVGGIPVYKDSSGAILYKAGCAVNADGSPHAYAPENSNLKALDYLANAGDTGNWWGIATDSFGNPYVQSAWHPAPGYYVSTTALCDPAYPEQHPLRYIDSERYGFSVIPGGQTWAKLGDVGLAYNEETGDNFYFAVGDVGPTNSLGEGSILLARCLGLNPDPKKGGTSKRIISYVTLPNSDPQFSPWEVKCKMAMRLIGEWGGLARLIDASRVMK